MSIVAPSLACDKSAIKFVNDMESGSCGSFIEALRSNADLVPHCWSECMTRYIVQFNILQSENCYAWDLSVPASLFSDICSKHIVRQLQCLHSLLPSFLPSFLPLFHKLKWLFELIYSNLNLTSIPAWTSISAIRSSRSWSSLCAWVK